VKRPRSSVGVGHHFSRNTHPINLTRLANKLKVSRQALYDNDLDEEIDRYKKLQHKNFSDTQSTPERKSKDQQIADLKEQVTRMKEQLDGWIEKWVTVEYNARMLGIDPDQIFADLPRPDRASTGRHNRRR
jgi:transcription termination factor NusB